MSMLRKSNPFATKIEFYDTVFADLNEFGIEIRNKTFENCRFVHSNFKLTDFERSQFVHTKLNSADFTDAINYSIDLNENDIRKAKFTLPDVINLLNSFEIEI